MIKVSVLYPNDAGATFDMAYYTSHHMPMVQRKCGSACNGIAVHGGFIPSGASFFCFTDYCRPSLRIAALMKIRVTHVFTHDSIGLGEDGPTHQPGEHLASLRAMPNFYV